MGDERSVGPAGERPLDEQPAEERAADAGRPDPLGFAADEMREFGYWVVDRVVERLQGIAERPAIRTASPAELWDALGGPVPVEGGEVWPALQAALDLVLANMQQADHPRNFARVPGPSSYVGVLGDWLGTGVNAIAASWTGGSGPTAVELIALDWLRSLLGLPEGTEGVMTSGGSLANLTALAAARAERGAGVAYLSDQAHASILRDLRVLGVQTRVLAADAEQRLSIGSLEAAVRKDRGRGAEPAIVVATAGTTNTGAVDPLPGLAALCREEGLWLHVDGAYGASAALCEAGKRALAGLAQADSLVLDPHKWLFQPYDLGCVLVTRRGALQRTFAMTPDYLADVTARTDEVDLRDRGLELSRRGRGLKLWLTFKIYGARLLGEAIEHGLRLAERAAALIAQDPAWEVVTAAQLGIVTFARRDAPPGEHAKLAAALADDGFALVTSTQVQGREVLRLCTINPRTTVEDVAATLAHLGVRTAPDA